MHVEHGHGTVEVTFKANAADTRRLVGRGADNLKQMAVLFRLLSRDTGKAVRLCDLLSNKNPEPPFEPYTPDPSWPREKIEGLLRELCEAVFYVTTEVRTDPHNEFSVKMRATVLADLSGNRVLGVFERAVNVLFVPIGTNAGMKVYAHVNDYSKAYAGSHAATGG